MWFGPCDLKRHENETSLKMYLFYLERLVTRNKNEPRLLTYKSAFINESAL